MPLEIRYGNIDFFFFFDKDCLVTPNTSKIFLEAQPPSAVILIFKPLFKTCTAQKLLEQLEMSRVVWWPENRKKNKPRAA